MFNKNTWIRQEGSNLIFECYVQPGSKKSLFADFFDGIPKIKIKAPASEGAANAELIRFLSQLFHCPKSNFQIVKGLQNRRKVLHIQNLSLEDFLAIFKKIST